MSLELAIDDAVRTSLERHLASLFQQPAPSPDPQDDSRLSTDKAAKLLGISPITMSIWRCQGTGPRYDKIGGRLVRYRRSDLEAFVSENSEKFVRENGKRKAKMGRPRKMKRG